MCLDWLDQQDGDRPFCPFCLFCHHKAPRRDWQPDEKHARMYEDEDIPEPQTLYDRYENRSEAALNAVMRVGVDMIDTDVKREIPRDLPEMELRKWADRASFCGGGTEMDRMPAIDMAPAWELFDLEKDPHEMHNVHADPAYAGVVAEMKAELRRLQELLGDEPVEEVG